MPKVQVISDGKRLFKTSKTKINRINMKGKYDGPHRFVLDPDWFDSLGSVKFELLDHCMACGSKENPTKHHVVPRRVVNLYPRRIVTKLFCRNTVRLCKDCHDAYNAMDECDDRKMSTRHWADKLKKFLDARQEAPCRT